MTQDKRNRFNRRDSLKLGGAAIMVGATGLIPASHAWALSDKAKERDVSDFDMTGGYDPAHEFLMASAHENPKMRDSVSMWISDDKGRFGFPRMTIEAISGEWNNRGVEANIAYPDGRVLIGAGGFPGAAPVMIDGKAMTINAGPLTFELIEPLRRWNMRFDGDAYAATVQDQMQGVKTGPLRKVLITVEAIMAVPPWSPGEQARDEATAKAVGAVGGHRHEQLFRCTGSFEVEGEQAQDFTGTGLFVRRTGARDVGDFPGHCWQSAVFPSGKAFGLLAFPPRNDGTPAYGEGFLFDGKTKTYAKVVEAPWMTRFVPHNGPVDVVLETPEGKQVRISGLTHDSTYIVKGNPMFGNWNSFIQEPNVKLPFHQGGARYEWDGEVAYGMVERSLPADKVSY